MSVVPFGWRSHWFQATGAVEVNNFFSALTPGEQRLAFLLMAGPEFHLSFLSNAIVQPRVAIRGGVQLGVRDGFGTHTCVNSSDPRWCTLGMLEGVFSLSLLERVRGQFISRPTRGCTATTRARSTCSSASACSSSEAQFGGPGPDMATGSIRAYGSTGMKPEKKLFALWGPRWSWIRALALPRTATSPVDAQRRTHQK